LLDFDQLFFYCNETGGLVQLPSMGSIWVSFMRYQFSPFSTRSKAQRGQATTLRARPKRSLTEWNSHGKDFHEFISVSQNFPGLWHGRLCFFCKDFTCNGTTRTSRNLTGAAKQEKLLYSDFTNRPDQKSNGLNPDDSANPDTTIKSLLFLHRFNFKVINVLFQKFF